MDMHPNNTTSKLLKHRTLWIQTRSKYVHPKNEVAAPVERLRSFHVFNHELCSSKSQFLQNTVFIISFTIASCLRASKNTAGAPPHELNVVLAKAKWSFLGRIVFRKLVSGLGNQNSPWHGSQNIFRPRPKSTKEKISQDANKKSYYTPPPPESPVSVFKKRSCKVASNVSASARQDLTT